MKERIRADWKWYEFMIGLSVVKAHRCSGYKLYISIDITFFSVWMYFGKIK